MRYRALSSDGDYTFGQGSANFLKDSPEAVAQSVLTRLRLWQGEWFLDVTSGTPWLQGILGTGTKPLYDLLIRQRVTDTLGVTGITSYTSQLDVVTRDLTVSMDIDTEFGQVNVTTVLRVN